MNEDEFTENNRVKAGYASNPLSSDELSAFRIITVAMTTLNEEAVRSHGLTPRDAARCRNFFALGLTLWLYDRPIQPMLEWLMVNFRKNPAVMGANGAAFRAGHNFADTAELFGVQHTVATASLPRGRYRRVTGNEAAALGLIAAAQCADQTLVYASYPITPASEILHELSKHKEYDVRALQTEDEIAACVPAIGASFAGAIGATGTNGPGLSLKTEGLGLAVMTELPLVCIDVQRSGPSTGMPTRTEQADLLMAMYGRHGECPRNSGIRTSHRRSGKDERDRGGELRRGKSLADGRPAQRDLARHGAQDFAKPKRTSSTLCWRASFSPMHRAWV